MSIYRPFMKIIALCVVAFTVSSASAGSMDSVLQKKTLLPKTDTARSMMISTALPPVSNPNRVYKFFPPDTMARFIKAYGKDSLLTLVNERILAANKVVAFYLKNLNDPFVALQFQMLNKHFKLGFDSARYNMETKVYFLRMYGENSGKIEDYIDTAKYMVADSQQFTLTYCKYLPDRFVRISVASLGDHMNILPSLFDTIYSLRTNLKLNEQIELYYMLSEYNRNNPERNLNAATYKNALFDSLYRLYNLSAVVERDTTGAGSKFTGYKEAINLLAYGLYGNNVTLKQHGRDIMYLLSRQKDDGGWSKYTETNTEIEMSIYGLWALLETRAKLKE